MSLVLHEPGFSGKIFTCVPSLTLLEVSGWYLLKKPRKIWRKWKNPSVLPQLKWLSLHHVDPQWLRIKLSACNLAILDLSNSKVTQKWDGWSQIKAAKNLKVLNLSYCNNLKRTPDLSALVKMERLILNCCRMLVHIHKSVGQLKRLVFLDLRNCRKLHELPEEVSQLESLIELVLTGSGITSLSGSVGNIKSLKLLRLHDTFITELPAGIERAENLEEIYAKDGLRKLPSEIRLSSLVMLKITGECSILNKVPKLPESLIHLHLEFQRYEPKNEVPDLSDLLNLRELDLKLFYHREAPSLFWWIGRLSKLETLSLTSYDIPRLCAEDDLGFLPLLKSLCLQDCEKLQSLPRLPSSLLRISILMCDAITEIHGLPSSLAELRLSECISLKSIGDISNLHLLSTLRVYQCAVTEIQGLDCLENLQILHLNDLYALERLPKDLSRLSQLKELNLCDLPRLPGLIPRLPFSLESLRWAFTNTSTMREIHGVEHLENLQFPTVTQISELESLPPSLKKLILIGCEQLLGLPRLPKTLVELDIVGCPIKMLDLSGLTELKFFTVDYCPIEEFRGLHCLVNLLSFGIDDRVYSKHYLGLFQSESGPIL